MFRLLIFRMPRVLNENKIQDFLLEDIPSDNESLCSVEPNEEYNDEPETEMVLGALLPQQPWFEEEINSDDEIPLSEFASTSHYHIPTTSSAASSSQTVVTEPKCKKNFRMEEPSEYTGGGGIPKEIINLGNAYTTISLVLVRGSCRNNLLSNESIRHTKRNTLYTHYAR